MENKVYDVVIIGAGISGISAARLLQSKGFDVLLIDKGRGIGGRMATRRVSVEDKDVYFDYGVQSFTVKLTPVKDLLHRNKIDRHMSLWTVEKNKRGLYLRGGNRVLAKILSRGLEVKKGEKVISVNKFRNWEVETDKKKKYHAKYVLSTAPAIQSLDLINKSNTQFSNEQLFMLDSVKYSANIVLLVRMNKKVELKSVQPVDKDISIVINNEDKGIKQEYQSFSVIFNAEYSENNYTKPDVEHLWNFIDEYPVIDRDNVAEFNIHRWKYAQPLNHIERYSFFKNNSGFYLSGDYFYGNNCSNVELAIYSGMEAANDIINSF
ncbi:MAG: hypothetical protein SCALA702_27220 [Melioribacteraceae bacterium]|nr:MAG: hypothetical protein SCALA702_27220 [Melioribacteraceae bacterium]